MIDSQRFESLWNALFGFKKHSHKANIKQQLSNVNVEIHDTNLIDRVYDEEKVHIVTRGIHELTSEILSELSHISALVAKPDDNDIYWNMVEKSLRNSISTFLDELAEFDSGLGSLRELIKSSQEDYITHYISYLRERAAFIHSTSPQEL